MKSGDRNRALFFIAATFLAGATLDRPAHATTMVQLRTSQLVDASSAIVRGTVTEIWTEQDDNGVVWTRAQVEVEKTYKGDSTATTAIIEQMGGQWGDDETIVHGSARFSAGEDGIFFLEQLGNGRTVVVGMSQGKYTLRLDPYSRSQIVQRFSPPPTQAYDHRFIPLPTKSERVYFDDFESMIKEHVRAGWNGQPIPGASMERLRRNNRVATEVK